VSRSRRKTSICGWTCARSEKQDKRLANRAFRHRVKGALATGRMMPQQREVSQVLSWDKDGKQWFDPDRFPEEMRK